MAIHRLTYVSRGAPGVRASELLAMVGRAWQSNTERGLTGLLCFDQGCFLQVLEGDPVPVNEVFFKIARDERHREVRLLRSGPVLHRAFDRWSMGFADRDLSELPGSLRGDEGYGPFPIDPDLALAFALVARTQALRFDTQEAA